MPGANLTRVEAEERKSIVSAPISYHVQLDLTRDARTFGSTTTICFGACLLYTSPSPRDS